MKLSARNQIPGHVAAISPGAVNGTVRVDIGNGMVVTASITGERSPTSPWWREMP